MVFTAARHSTLFMPRDSCPQPHKPKNHLILSSKVSLDLPTDAAFIYPEYNNGYISIHTEVPGSIPGATRFSE